MGTTPTPDRAADRTPAGRPPTAPHPTRPHHEGGVHRWSEVDGDERRGYTMTCLEAPEATTLVRDSGRGRGL